MAPGMQFRLWLRGASTSQRLVTAAISGLVVILIGFSVVPEGSSTDSLGVTYSPAQSTTGGSTGGLGTTGGGSPTAGTAGSTGTTSGGSGGSTTGAVGTTSGGSQGGTTTGGTSGGGRGSTGPTSAPHVPLVASDVGITAKTIKIGFSTINLAGAQAAGSAAGLRSDAPRAIQAFVAYANAHGGAAGRHITADIKTIDLIDEGDQNKACTYFADDAKVFGVIDSAAFLYQSSQQCLTQDRKLPLVHTYALDEKFQAAGQGRDITVSRNLNRIAREWITAAKDQHFLVGGEVVGIMAQECDTVVDSDMIPLLKHGTAIPKKIVIGHNGCTPSTAQNGISQAVLDFYNQGVTKVFMAIGGGTTAQAFLEQAHAQRAAHKPFTYFASEYKGLSDPGQTKSFNPDEWNGTKGVVANFHGYVEAGHKPLPMTKFCSDIMVKAGLPTAERMTAGDQEVLVECDHFFIMVKALNLAGPNPTRKSWAQAVQTIGTGFQSVLDPMVSLKPGKFSAADGIANIRWYAACTCYKQTSGYRMGKF